MRDPEIREALHRKVLARHHKNPNTLVIDELGLWHGTARVDVAVLNGTVHGFEIKSERDNLSRLPNQVEVYSEILDKVTVVSDVKHMLKIFKIVPIWWGLIVVSRGPKGGMCFSTLRPSARNPGVNPHSLATLLWREEALNILAELQAAQGLLSKPRHDIYTKLATLLTLNQLRLKVLDAIKNRQNWRVGQQQN
jgi:hypothetical protein